MKSISNIIQEQEGIDKDLSKPQGLTLEHLEWATWNVEPKNLDQTSPA